MKIKKNGGKSKKIDEEIGEIKEMLNMVNEEKRRKKKLQNLKVEIECGGQEGY